MEPALRPGETFVKWKVEKLLGAGGMGEVVLARDEWLCRDVALKVLPVRVTDDPMYVDRMRREAAAGTTVRHPNLVEVIDGGLADGKAYLVMEYLPNAQTLRTAMRRGRIALERAGACGGNVGNGGGASLALVSVNATSTLTSTVIRTADGGAGGEGAPGQLGQEGGNGNLSGGIGACSGGEGGDGGRGGSGGGRRGGHSLGIAYAGTAPARDETVSFDIGTEGPGGAGGVGVGNVGGEGAEGESADMLEVPGA